ncbi:MAG: putative DNA binding domain-containing protein [Gammaproteobacteria bacterium]|nr:putative DNA binding domain-containing protein [Gammaproteobacteria bacterium]MCY4341462.1 putative DNA binding domain-containing protein [Gammaproteobacteria bacterium]
MTDKLPINLGHLLRQRTVEGERIEYKAGWNPKSVLHAICAFANDFHNLGGGYVILGVKEKDGRPVLPPKGISPQKINAIQNELLALGHSAIRPHYHPLTATYSIEGRTILALWVPGGETRPYKARTSLAKGRSDWAYYIRKHSSTVRARDADARELMSLAATVPFDDRYRQTASINDLSGRLVRNFLRDIGSDLAAEATDLSMAELGQRMNIVGGPPEAMFPKNVGLLFFNDRPHDFFPSTQIDVVWFPDGPGGDRFEEKEFRGPLSLILGEAIGYVERNYLKETVVKHPHKPEAERFWNFPIGAIEEALVNAIYHRSYEEREPVEVRITAEELVVLSFPGADRSIRMEDFQKGQAVSRRYRNRRIGEFLKELDLAEGRSTGVPKILRAMRENGSPAPVFESDDDRTFFLVRLPVHEQVGKEVAQQETVQDAGQFAEQDNLLEIKQNRNPLQVTGQDEGQVTVHDTVHDAQQDTAQVTDQVRELVAVLGTEMGRNELQAAMELVNRSHFTTAYLKPALDAGLIEMTLPDKPTSRHQRYRRTVAGQDLAERIKGKGGSA